MFADDIVLVESSKEELGEMLKEMDEVSKLAEDEKIEDQDYDKARR
ncbi:MAG: hypothetical protein ACL7AX_12025 [Candidatus Arsenophonus phytopathogenicus]